MCWETAGILAIAIASMLPPAAIGQGSVPVATTGTPLVTRHTGRIENLHHPPSGDGRGFIRGPRHGFLGTRTMIHIRAILNLTIRNPSEASPGSGRGFAGQPSGVARLW